MTSYATRTAEFGKVTFIAPAASDTYAGNVWIECDGVAGRKQICHGGEFRGSTVQATSKGIKEAAQAWMRQRREWQRKEGL